ncbi:TPA: TerB family tellurite resistance protein [Vibrio vulnificus]|nr:TerB family tellurite resistance protein [Vibrio vulnificus]
MLDILDVINEATKEANSFENHAAKDLTLEERLLYLQGLALVMNADGEIHQEEKEYIRILIKSFEMDESILESFVEFAQRPDKDTVQAFFRTFRRRPIAQLFLFDALMMTHRDDSVDDREKAVVDKIAEQLEVLKGTYQDIYDLFCHIKNNDWNESSLYFSSHLLNVDFFKHLLSFYSIDYADFLDRTRQLNKVRFQQYLQKKLGITDISWGELSYNNENIDVSHKNVSLKPVKNLKSFSYQVIVPYIQHLIDRDEASVNNEVLYLGKGTSEEYVFNLNDVSLKYEKIDRIILLDGVDEKAIINCPDNLLDKMLGLVKTGNPLIDFDNYIKSIGLSIAWIEIFDDKIYFPKINGKLTDSSEHPSINIDAYCNVQICHSDGSMGMNYIEEDKVRHNKPCLSYISNNRFKDIGSSRYHYTLEKVVDNQGISEGSYYLGRAIYDDGVPDEFAIDLPKTKHDSADWISLKNKISFKDIIEAGCYLIK